MERRQGTDRKSDPAPRRPAPGAPAEGNPGDVASVGRGVSELRLTFGPGYRAYYLQEGERLILLLVGGNKSTQQKDIEKAHRLAEEWRAEEDSDDPKE